MDSLVKIIYKGSFPKGIRTTSNNPTSVAYALDEARVAALESLYTDILEMGKQFQILTMTTALDDLEDFLRIPRDNTLTTSERRVRILIKMAGQPATIQNIKTIAKEITGTMITIYEYGKPDNPYYDPTDHPWKVKIVVDRNDPDIKNFTKAYFEETMMAIFPAHTEFEADSFEYIPKLSYLAPTTGGKTPFVLGQEWLQISN